MHCKTSPSGKEKSNKTGEVELKKKGSGCTLANIVPHLSLLNYQLSIELWVCNKTPHNTALTQEMKLGHGGTEDRTANVSGVFMG